METPFDELDSFVAIKRLAALALSPDGTRLVTAVQQLDPEGTKYLTALWEVDPTGEGPARRLTRSAEGESAPAFLPGGDLLFISKRPDPDSKPDDDSKPALWLLPAGAGEARELADRPGGIGGVKVAHDSGTIVFTSATMPGAKTADDDAERRKARKDSKVAAILHDAYPIRFWDHDLGPDQVRLFSANAPDPAAGDPRLEPRDLTPDPRAGFDVPVSYDVSADGRVVVTAWRRRRRGGELVADLVAIDTESGDRRTLVTSEDYDADTPAISPDGRQVAYLRHRIGRDDIPLATSLWLTSLDADPAAPAEERQLAADLDLWPGAPLWSRDGRTIYFSTDQNGRHPVFAVDVASGQARRLVADATYTDLAVDPSGQYLYALRNAVDSPALPVRLDTTKTDQEPVFLQAPVERPQLPGRLEEVTATAQDGSPLRAWLVLPDSAKPETPAPLLLWIHGGPYSSWNGWHWRWNPWLAAARGYAVLLPDPALSTGYGERFIARGWGEWGGAPYTDLMTITDTACARPDLDQTKTAALGGSFGGYMANWVAGHTDRFKAIVTHASLWALDQFGPTTDLAGHWFRELTPERAARNSPHASAGEIRTPMLVIHGDKDYRVPIGEGLRLWWDLVRGFDGDPADLPHRFLYFPDENHWILAPQQAKVWYDTVFAFLAWHVHDEPWERPELL
ncbi:S9 family peptidase [Flindersiella endophytica]